jgi:glycosyltransferase involved in cell wall biosynthesis
VNLLLEAFDIVRLNYPDTALLRVGGGDDIERLKGQAHQLGILGPSIFRGRACTAQSSFVVLSPDECLGRSEKKMTRPPAEVCC